MTDWLAIVAFCINGECSFWANTKEPIESKAECRRIALEVESVLKENGADQTIATCLPIKWIKA